MKLLFVVEMVEEQLTVKRFLGLFAGGRGVGIIAGFEQEVIVFLLVFL